MIMSLPSFQEAVSWLQSASQSVPISQLSIAAWILFRISCSFGI